VAVMSGFCPPSNQQGLLTCLMSCFTSAMSYAIDLPFAPVSCECYSAVPLQIRQARGCCAVP
jgi:hypothetical protein